MIQNPIVESLVAITAALLVAAGVAWAGSQGGLSVAGMPLFALAGLVAFAIQWVVFVPSYWAQTEHWYDLTGSLTYLVAVLGTLLLVTGCSMVLPVVCALLFGEDDWRALTLSATIIIFGGLLVRRFFRFHGAIQVKDGVLVAVAGWVVISAVSTLPFLVSGYIPSFTDAFFEMMSGYTTTGATILEDIEALPHGLLFWRSQTHLLGGMGFSP